MNLEYDWTLNVYRFRFGTTWIDVDGFRHAETKQLARSILNAVGLDVGKKTGTRTWEIKTLA